MHKLRIRNLNESGSSQGTEVWIDDFRLEGVTRVRFGAELNTLIVVEISIHVCDVDIAAPARLEMEVENFGPYYRARDALERLIQLAQENRATVPEILAAIVDLKLLQPPQGTEP